MQFFGGSDTVGSLGNLFVFGVIPALVLCLILTSFYPDQPMLRNISGVLGWVFCGGATFGILIFIAIGANSWHFTLPVLILALLAVALPYGGWTYFPQVGSRWQHWAPALTAALGVGSLFLAMLAGEGAKQSLRSRNEATAQAILDQNPVCAAVLRDPANGNEHMAACKALVESQGPAEKRKSLRVFIDARGGVFDFARDKAGNPYAVPSKFQGWFLCEYFGLWFETADLKKGADLETLATLVYEFRSFTFEAQREFVDKYSDAIKRRLQSAVGWSEADADPAADAPWAEPRVRIATLLTQFERVKKGLPAEK